MDNLKRNSHKWLKYRIAKQNISEAVSDIKSLKNIIENFLITYNLS